MSSHAAGTWASQNRLNQTGRIPDAEKRVEYSRGIMAQGSQNQHKEWARRGISGENTSNNGLPKGGSPGAMRDALAGSPKNHGRVDHARKELFGNLQPRAEFNRNPDLTGREGNLARNRSDLRPYNSGTPLSMAAATLEDAQGRAPAADEPESSHGRRRNAELAPYNEWRAQLEPGTQPARTLSCASQHSRARPFAGASRGSRRRPTCRRAR
jgi:hypothetical protein